MNNIFQASALVFRLEKQFAILPLISLLFASCSEEPVPAYIHVSSFTVTAGHTAGSASSNISDAWVYQSGNLQGVYELPARFPVIPDDSRGLVVFAGIKLNGIAATRAAYPFYIPDTIDLILEPRITDTLHPTVKYAANAVFDFIEDFESGSSFSNMQSAPEDIFEGSASGKLVVADSGETFALSDSAYAIPFITRAVFLEMDYKNNEVFEVGIRARSGNETFDFYKITIAARNDWNKIYVNFTPEIIQLQAETYQIYFRILTGSGAASVKIYFDNIKLIHAKT